MPERIMLQCSTQVNRNAVRRDTIDGVEHIIISSMTLPDDIVMNGMLYPAEEIAKGFPSLERTLAPVEHPTDADGRFLPATDPAAIHNFYAGAYNANVKRENGRVSIDKVINVQEAMKSERGRRLLDRVSELETNQDARPVHTSVGVFVNVERLEDPQTNAANQEYSMIARDMIFDHDAILLDSVGAAQPDQGVGLAVNADGEDIEVHTSLVTIDGDKQGALSHTEIRDALEEAIRVPPLRGDFVSDIIENTVIFWSDDQMFSADFVLEDRAAKIVSIPVPVVRDLTYTPRTNHEGDAMKDLMLKALSDAGITVNADATDDEILAQYNALLATQNSSDDEDDAASKAVIADAVANAVKPLADELAGLKATINSQGDAELNELAELIGNSDKYPGIDVEAAKKLGVETLKGMATNCVPAHGIPSLHVVNGKTQDEPFAMPK